MRLPALVLLACLVGWFAVPFTWPLGRAAPAWFGRTWWVWWLGSWEMFTLLDPHASLVVAEVNDGREWHEVDLLALFPTRWESGPRYARSAFYNDPHALRVLADSTCGRLPERPERVRFRRLKWHKTLGVPSRVAPADASSKVLLEWRCGSPVKRPRGRRL